MVIITIIIIIFIIIIIDDSFERVVHNLVDHPGSSDAGKVRPLSKELVMHV